MVEKQGSAQYKSTSFSKVENSATVSSFEPQFLDGLLDARACLEPSFEPIRLLCRIQVRQE